MLARLTGAVFRSLSQARGKRIVHPEGVGFSGRLLPAAGLDTGVSLFDSGAPQEVVVRLSRAAGIPEILGDPCGLGLRIVDAHGPDRHQDLLLISSGRLPGARHLILPSWGFAGRPYSSLLPYKMAGRTVILGARAVGAEGSGPSLSVLAQADRPGLGFELAFATPTGSWTTLGLLDLERRLDPARVEALRLNPWNCGGGIEPTGYLNRLRLPAYRGSQTGRPIPVPAEDERPAAGAGVAAGVAAAPGPVAPR